MRQPIKLPRLGESVTEAVITGWLVEEGTRVAVGDPLVEISADKVDTTVDAPVSGVLVEVTAAVDDEVEVGAVLAVIDTDD